MRPGCDRPAAARVAFDPVALQLWLDPLALHVAPVQELCELHIERLTIPRGWTATDRRPSAGADPLAAVTAPTGVAAPTETEGATVASVDEPRDAAPQVEAPQVDEPQVEEPQLEEPQVDEPQVEEQSARSMIEPGEPESPPAPEPPRRRRRARSGEEPSLLSRAFALSGPQESVLTTGQAGPGSSEDAPE
ncbi:MAG: DUF3499 family protein [Actinobacteria bacterium]|nr:DUF3499 family protein [Actinomycetota bacterium]